MTTLVDESKDVGFCINEKSDRLIAEMRYLPSKSLYGKEMADQMFPMSKHGFRVVAKNFSELRKNAVIIPDEPKDPELSISEQLDQVIVKLRYRPSLLMWGEEMADQMFPMTEKGIRTIAKNYVELRAKATIEPYEPDSDSDMDSNEGTETTASLTCWDDSSADVSVEDSSQPATPVLWALAQRYRQHVTLTTLFTTTAESPSYAEVVKRNLHPATPVSPALSQGSRQLATPTRLFATTAESPSYAQVVKRNL